ncbi:MAG TPA: hypothetical protein VI636_14105 [Candidatus Angelobacter sp.]
MNEKNPMSKESIAAKLVSIDWKNVGSVVAGVVALLYVLGLIVSNEYLNCISASNFALLRPQCIFTGTWTLALLFLGALPAIGGHMIAGRQPNKWRKWLFFPIGILCGWVLTVMGSWIVLKLLQTDTQVFWYNQPAGLPQPWHFLLSVKPMLYIATWYLVFPTIVWLSNPRAFVTFTSAPIRHLVILLVFLSVWATWGIASEIYPHVPKAMAGGKPQVVVLFLTEDGKKVWSELRDDQHPQTAAQANAPQGTAPPATGTGAVPVTPKVNLLYETSDQAFIQLNTDKPICDQPTIKLDRKLVGAIRTEK